jgi:hypothetical protein
MEQYKRAGLEVEDDYLFAYISRIHRKNSKPGSPYLSQFKAAVKEYGMYLGYGNDRDKVGHLEILPIDLLSAHLDASFIFNHLDTMNGGPNFSSVTPPRKKS